MRVDLHIHTKYSDGEIDILEAVPSLFTDYDLVAFTDHEYIFDPNDLSAATPKKFISGVEICCQHEGESIEIIGYDFDTKNTGIIKIIDEIKALRVKIIKDIFDRNGFTTEKLPANPFRINVTLPSGVNRFDFWKLYNSEYRTNCHTMSAACVID